MPTYEYLCKSCGFEFEEFQSMAAEPLSVCPRCGGAVRRLISGGSGLIFKGSGFYETDYKRKPFSDSSSEKHNSTSSSIPSKPGVDSAKKTASDKKEE
ncbi:MAG: zinc ribbon domain-containing protein [bacterium]|nr:zinc ribbon domain-containing protein [bacterium]